jgi:hypothetical protein
MLLLLPGPAGSAPLPKTLRDNDTNCKWLGNQHWQSSDNAAELICECVRVSESESESESPSSQPSHSPSHTYSTAQQGTPVLLHASSTIPHANPASRHVSKPVPNSHLCPPSRLMTASNVLWAAHSLFMSRHPPPPTRPAIHRQQQGCHQHGSRPFLSTPPLQPAHTHNAIHDYS